MAKNKNLYHKEYTKDQKLSHKNKILQKENEKLKREILQLRKELSKIDLKQLEEARDIILAEEFAQNKKPDNLSKEELWRCFECKTGVLEIIIYYKANETYYFRRCNNRFCCKKTKPQKYTDKVKGIHALKLRNGV